MNCIKNEIWPQIRGANIMLTINQKIYIYCNKIIKHMDYLVHILLTCNVYCSFQ